MSGRMLTPIFLLAVLQIVTRRRDGGAIWAAAAVITIAASLAGPRSPLLFDPREAYPEAELIEPTGIADERLIYHQQGMGLLLTTRNNPVRHPFIRLGIEARTGPPIVTAMTIGMMGYYAGPGVHIVDIIGLSEPLLARLPAKPQWRIGHYFREVPEGYLETLAAGRNLIRDARIATLYSRIVTVTRGPIWNPNRLRSILLRRLI
jgi:arabinofuranosyltransferase